MIDPLPVDIPVRPHPLPEFEFTSAELACRYDDVTRLAALVCNTPIAAVSFVDDGQQMFQSSVGLDAIETQGDGAFCAQTILQNDLLVVQDASLDDLFHSNPLVIHDPNVRFFAGMPLVTDGGNTLGSLCVMDTKPRNLDPDQRTALKTLARQVLNQLELVRQVAAQESMTTERERTQNALITSELRYRRLFETARDGILILDAETAKVTNANPFMSELLGYSQEEFLGKELWEIGLLQDKATSQNAFKQLQRNGYIRYEGLPLQTRDGKRWAVEFISNVYHEGQSSVIQCNIRDITVQKATQDALRASEQFAQATLNGLSTEIAILDSSGIILAVNHAWEQFAANNPPVLSNVSEGANYLHACDAATGEGQEGARQAAFGIRSVTAGEQELFVLEYPCHSADEQRWFTLRASQFPKIPGDEHARVVISHEDVTQRKLAELSLAAALEEAQVLADHDPLTNLVNHRVFHARLEDEISAAMRESNGLAVVILDIDNFKFFNDLYGHEAGDAVLCTVALRLQMICTSDDTAARFGGDEFALILPHVGDITLAELELRLNKDMMGLAFHTNDGHATIPITLSLGLALCPQGFADCRELLRNADERLLWTKTGGRVEDSAQLVRIDAGARVQGFSMLDALVTAVDNKDRYTRRHSEDVMEYSLLIARELGMDDNNLDTVAVAALIHDVGKIGVPDYILRKPGKLTDPEFEAVKQHPTMGAVMVGAVPGLEGTLDAVHHHHERWDGKGYPFGLKGDETPLVARLMAVADAFSAMTTDRPYRKGMNFKEALSILEDGAGTQWDPRCVSAFLSGLKRDDGVDSPSKQDVI